MNLRKILGVVILILVGFLCSQKTEAKTTTVLYRPQDQAISSPLTEKSVRDFIETRIAEYKLQKEMEARANEYENVIKAFYQKRKDLIESRGWIIEDYENVNERVLIAQNAMEQELDLKREEALNREIAEIEANTFYSAEQKSQLIGFLRNDRKRILEEVIEPSKPDWPAVKAYLTELDQLEDYLAGNRPDAPVLGTR
ncbi:MAG: hypothetical protein RBR87_00645 [Bacteroidales bacterium]|jgi:hypothetical protein|nr:hypothetical protein [Bacteroidales bacterium]